MPSLALAILECHDEGKHIPSQSFDGIPPLWWRAHFAELSKICPSCFGPSAGQGMGQIGHQRNSLRVELVSFTAYARRCKLQSPDGRGMIWYMSGGSPLAYGECSYNSCPRNSSR